MSTIEAELKADAKAQIEAGLSQRGWGITDLSKASGVNRSVIYRALDNTSPFVPSGRTMGKIREALSGANGTPAGEVGGRIREAREALGLSQAQLAEQSGTTQQTVDRIERGETGFSRALDPIRAALGLEEPPADEQSLLRRRVGERLKITGLSPNAASQQAELGRDYVRDIQRGKIREPSATALRRLADVLGCSADWLVGSESPAPTASPSPPDGDANTLRQAASVLRSYGKDATARELDELAQIIARAQERGAPRSNLTRPFQADVIDPEWLKAELAKDGRSQAALARALGVDQAAVNRLVNGQRELKAREIPIVQGYLADTAA